MNLDLRDFCYSNFHWLSRPLCKMFRGLESNLDAASMRIHPEVYLSMVGFLSILSILVPSAFLAALAAYGSLTGIVVFPLNFLLSAPTNIRLVALLSIAMTPILVIIFGVTFPMFAASNRTSKLKNEIPYASMYMSVMTSGGLTPYQSLLRMTENDLLPTIQQEMKRLQSLVLSSGSDPISAMEQAVKVIDIREYKRLLLGYASTVRRGGDVLHYLYNQTDSMFEGISIRIKSMGEHLSMIMEANIIVSILGVLGLIMIFIVSLSLPEAGISITVSQFYLFSFAVLPMISIFFIYAGDAIQISEPVSNWKAYIPPLAAIPLGVLIVSQTTLPSLFDLQPVFKLPLEALKYVAKAVNLGEGTESVLGLALALLSISIPGWVGDWYYAGRDKKILEEVTTFIRDIVETRKTGLSPERCIIALSDKDYGNFSPHLKLISLKLKWGFPIRQIFDEFRSHVNAWLSQIIVYFLIDTIEVGGGTEESLETLAEFVEKTRHLEQERRGLLLPLTIIPYIGAILLTMTTVIFLQFFTNMSSLGGFGVPYIMLNKALLTPLVLHSFILGLVTGKLGCSNRISAGFLHSTVLVIISIIGIWVSANFLSPSLGTVV
ncbi:MAG: type II secretion system F family protein [Candidatus Bathyarchaeia archaeon]